MAAGVLRIICKWMETEQEKGSQSPYLADLRSMCDAILADSGVQFKRRESNRRVDGIAEARDTGEA